MSTETVTQTEAAQSEGQAAEIVNFPVPVKAFGKTYQIARFTLGPAFRALEFVGPFGFLLKTIMQMPRDAEGKIGISEEEKREIESYKGVDDDRFQKLLAEAEERARDRMIELAVTAISLSGPSGLGLISVATNEPIEWLEDKDPFDGIEVLAVVLEKNLDFFSPENIERVTKMFGGLQRAMLAFGGNTSTTSSETATDH